MCWFFYFFIFYVVNIRLFIHDSWTYHLLISLLLVLVMIDIVLWIYISILSVKCGSGTVVDISVESSYCFSLRITRLELSSVYSVLKSLATWLPEISLIEIGPTPWESVVQQLLIVINSHLSGWKPEFMRLESL